VIGLPGHTGFSAFLDAQIADGASGAPTGTETDPPAMIRWKLTTGQRKDLSHRWMSYEFVNSYAWRPERPNHVRSQLGSNWPTGAVALTVP
jgi:hypothetical protein